MAGLVQEPANVANAIVGRLGRMLKRVAMATCGHLT
jgi:hypothetical protein